MPSLQFRGRSFIERHHENLPHHSLLPNAELSVLPNGENPSLSGNLIVEGDNLLALQTLLPMFRGRVKCIYIDPPYNTGNEHWVYNDNVSGALFKEWLGQEVGPQGEDFNRHDKWCCMMYPRLQLLKELLRDDGVIFVSIGEDEVTHLRLLMDEIFSPENFAAMVTVQVNPRGRSFDKFIAKTHEYILIYARDLSKESLRQVAKSETAIAEYNKEDEVGKYRELELRNRNPVFSRQNRPNLYYPIFVNPESGACSIDPETSFGVEVYPLNTQDEEGCWTWGKKKAREEISLLTGRQARTGAWRVYRKDYLSEESGTTKAKSIWLESQMNYENGKEELGRIFGKTPFDFPKSVELIKKCVLLSTSDDANEEDIVLDSFAGSGTTAHATLALNAEDGGNRRFILVQMPYDNKDDERAGKNIARDITRERVKRVVEGVGRTVPALGGSFTSATLSEEPLKGYYGLLRAGTPWAELAGYIWQAETLEAFDPIHAEPQTGLVGRTGEMAVYLLYTPATDESRAFSRANMELLTTETAKTIVVYCEKLCMDKDAVRDWAKDQKNDVRVRLLPTQLQ